MNNSKKTNILLGLVSVVLIAVFFVDPIPQDLEYHQFSDQNTYWGIPNTWNVLSNIPFIVVGLFGLVGLRHVNPVDVSGRYKTVSLIFFIGLTLTGFGSGYYHLAPSNETLIWDRLPMTIAFMAFFSFVLLMHISERIGSILLWPLIVVGAGSVFYWAYTESIGVGDLRFYAVIQFLPMLLIPTIVCIFPRAAYKSVYVWGVIAVYIAAKIGEHFDDQVYVLLGVSGHSLKHVVAALSGIAFFYAIRSINPDRLTRKR